MAAARSAWPRPDGLTPNLILVDMHLPDMAGHDVVRAILDDPVLYRVPCIAFSADMDEGLVEAAIRSGFREYMHKPIAAAEFLSLIDSLMSADPKATQH